MRVQPVLRLSLRQQVYSSLLRLLLEGRWQENSRLNDSALAAELGVSRTPVREALIQLDTEGLLACDPNRGFFLPPLRPEEARELYPILWSLEQLAVFLSAGASGDLRNRLDQVNSRLAAAVDPAAALKHDRAWHAALVEASGNARLVALAGQIEALSRRYGAVLPRESSSTERRQREHGQIAEALATDQPARAFALLKMHWRAEMEEVLQALEARATKPAPALSSERPTGSRRQRAAAAGKP
ncbi:MAG TPA: GntR family transcriptional regulator [Candidatus Acidoferrales bacterium]|nr:GntR family transcriptional regulator [Candidatus Acidoferrales bacterium]